MKKITKPGLLKVLNPVLFFILLLQVVTVIFFLTGTYFPWLYGFHIYNGLAFFAAVFLHIYLNWNWIKANILKTR